MVLYAVQRYLSALSNTTDYRAHFGLEYNNNHFCAALIINMHIKTRIAKS